MLSQQIIISDDDDDYELPSLSERIKASVTFQKQNITHHISSDSEDEDSSFLKFSEKIRNTPCSQVKFNQKSSSDEKIEESQMLKNVEKSNPPPVNIKLDFSLTSESEDEEAEFLNFSRRIQSTPQVKSTAQVKSLPQIKSPPQVKCTPQVNVSASCYITSESESDEEVFSNLTERLKLLTPRTEDKENYDASLGSIAKKQNTFLTPLPPGKKVPYKAVDSESDESFSNFIEILRTPMSVNRKIPQKALDSESDESFSSFLEKIRTPLSVNRRLENKVIESDSDDSFLNSLKKHPFKTPKSQKKIQKDAVILPKITELKHHPPSTVEDTPNSLKIRKSETEKEFNSLFEPERISSTFPRKRKTYTHMLYKFYNRKVFNSRLPRDMPVFYDGALKSTAGITCCSVKNGIWNCSIKLSPSLMNSFDRLKETLLHEMCHAAVWIVNKQRHVRHGPLWQIWASRCKLILPFIECPTRCHNYEISYSVWYQCPKCQWKSGRCKQVKKYHGALCKTCKTPITVTYN